MYSHITALRALALALASSCAHHVLKTIPIEPIRINRFCQAKSREGGLDQPSCKEAMVRNPNEVGFLATGEPSSLE